MLRLGLLLLLLLFLMVCERAGGRPGGKGDPAVPPRHLAKGGVSLVDPGPSQHKVCREVASLEPLEHITGTKRPLLITLRVEVIPLNLLN